MTNKNKFKKLYKNLCEDMGNIYKFLAIENNQNTEILDSAVSELYKILNSLENKYKKQEKN